MIDTPGKSSNDDDEKLDASFKILRNDTLELPSFVASRNSSHLHQLRTSPHAHSTSIDIHSTNSLSDILHSLSGKVLCKIDSSNNYDRQLASRRKMQSGNRQTRRRVFSNGCSQPPRTFVADLAVSLTSLSNHLVIFGSPDGALRPTAFMADLAMSLNNNLSNHLDHVGRPEEALALRVCEEAVSLCRSLAHDRPAAFNPKLAMSLYNVSGCLDNSGRREDAIAACEEALAVCQGLAAGRPLVFNSKVTMCLKRLSGLRWRAAWEEYR